MRLVTDNRYLFNGKEWQPTGDLDVLDYGARHYDPELGRWFNPDPAMQFLNPYTFCGNDPVNLVDLNGMYAKNEKDLEEFPVDSDDGESDGHINHDKEPEVKKEIDRLPGLGFEFVQSPAPFNFQKYYEKILSKDWEQRRIKLDWERATPGEKIRIILIAYRNAVKSKSPYFDLREYVDNFPFLTDGEHRLAVMKINGETIPVFIDIAYYNNMQIGTNYQVQISRNINYLLDGLYKDGSWSRFLFLRYTPYPVGRAKPMLEIQVPDSLNKSFTNFLNSY